jgi:hypothetical protein
MSNALFRIRQKMIAEKRYRDYLVFGLGEMLLIIIGILLALQIDNWNQSRQDKKVIKAYFVKISSNIESDISQLNTLMEERKQALIYTDTILGYYNKKQISDSKLYENGFKSIFIETKFNPNKSAHESLKNSGFMSNLKNPNIEEHLSSYYYLMERVSFVEEKFIGVIQPIETILSEDGFFIEFKEMFYWDHKDTLEFTYEAMLKYPDLESTFIRAEMFLEELINGYTELSEKGYEVIDLLRSEV